MILPADVSKPVCGNRSGPIAKSVEQVDIAVIGAGAAGLFFAAEAARRGARVVALDHARKLGEKIRISGGGRCNFTNINARPENFLSQNPKFAISALRRFSAQDFLARVERRGIGWHEKKLGQLFCDDSAQQIIDMLIDDCRDTGVDLRAATPVSRVARGGDGFAVETAQTQVTARKLVVATGGKSIPKIGATGFGYQLAEQFGLTIVPPRPALVPLTFAGDVLDMARSLSGVSVDAAVSAPAAAMRAGQGRRQQRVAFRDGFLFTHRGLSGPSILQISNYWREGESLAIDLCPANDSYAHLKDRKAAGGRVAIQTALADLLPKRLAMSLCESAGWAGNLADWPDKRLRAVADRLHQWQVTPAGSEGYRTAEVTLGGVSTDELNSRTMEATSVPGLYFIGEVVDVTGWLGGYNFQWAWSSAYAAAHAV